MGANEHQWAPKSTSGQQWEREGIYIPVKFLVAQDRLHQTIVVHLCLPSEHRPWSTPMMAPLPVLWRDTPVLHWHHGVGAHRVSVQVISGNESGTLVGLVIKMKSLEYMHLFPPISPQLNMYWISLDSEEQLKQSCQLPVGEDTARLCCFNQT